MLWVTALLTLFIGQSNMYLNLFPYLSIVINSNFSDNAAVQWWLKLRLCNIHRLLTQTIILIHNKRGNKCEAYGKFH